MPSGILLGGCVRAGGVGGGHPQRHKLILQSEENRKDARGIEDVFSTAAAEVALRGERGNLKRRDLPNLKSGSKGGSGSLTCPVNKRNATYLNEEEYDEDLAQLDMLLHYVNNLSASLEFLQWENKRISTDLVPTLLTMYDALYARLSETPNAAQGTPGKTSHVETQEDENGNRNTTAEKSESFVESYNKKDDLYIREIEIKETESANKDPSVKLNYRRKLGTAVPFICEKCGEGRGSTSCGCLNNRNKLLNSRLLVNGNSCDSGLFETFDKRLSIDNDYDIPESVEKASDDEKSSKSSPITSANSALHYQQKGSSFIRGIREGSPVTTLNRGSPLLGSRLLAARCLDPRKFQQNASRPLSSISTSSSSSSSSNSLPRGTAPVLAYLASAESLDNEESPTIGTEATRRRDRSLKSRREKSLRTGSDDSGVQCHSISLPAPPTLRPRYCDPHLGYMDRVVLEIIETEEVYVRDLKEVIEGYLHYWRKSCEHGICSETVENLFSNIEQIYEFNRCLLSDLENCGSDPVAVARCFVNNNVGFTIYTDYCTNYPKTVDVLTKMMKKETSVKGCRERQLSLGHTLPLGSYLLKPVQRVLKYHLLLGNILKHFDKDSPGHGDIVNALSTMTGMAHHINDMKRRHEHSVRVQEIQSLLIGWQGNDLTTYGELAAEGAFRIFGFKGLRHVFLFDKMLLLTKKKDENLLIYKTHIMCSNLMLIESIPKEPLSFHVIPFDCPRHQYTLECRNLEQKREWTLQLKRVIIENFSAAIPAHARQLVMELGQAKPDDGSALESRGGGRRMHHAPEYLERRKDRRRVSETGINHKLRLRRSSRSRKDKEEKGPRCRSASRTRELEEDRNRKNSSETPPEKPPRLKIPLWRRRSEPGCVDSLPSTPELTPHPSPNPKSLLCRSDSTEDGGREPKISREEAKCQRLQVPQDTADLSSTPECEREVGDDDTVEGESLEDVISKLLHHQLQVQQSLLNKQRRNLIRNKKVSHHYETSDTEVDESTVRPPMLPTSPPPPLLNDSQHSISFDTNDLKSLSLEYDTTSEWRSGVPSLCSSIASINQQTDFETLLNFESKSTSDLLFKPADNQSKCPNYDNLLNVWGRGRSPEKKGSCGSNQNQVQNDNIKRALRRVQSFNEEQSAFKEKPAYLIDERKFVPLTFKDDINISCRDEFKDKERPATIAVYDSTAETFDDLEKYLNNSFSSKTEKGDKFPTVALTRQKPSDVIIRLSPSHVNSNNNVHPEHKIYSKASVNKGSIRKILSKISLPKSPLGKFISEPPSYPSNIYEDFDKHSSRKSSSLVSTMARHCSKTIKEKIKQITADELDVQKQESTDKDAKNDALAYKHNSSSVGARLANTTEQSDYALLHIRNQDSKLDPRPDSVLSSSSIWTSASSSSSNTSYSNCPKKEDSEVALDNIDIIEELEVPNTFHSDLSGDSFYEKSFEAIETLLENDLFRDSAIYSDPEDVVDTYPKSISRSWTLSPKSSFRISDYIKYDETVRKKSYLIHPKFEPMGYKTSTPVKCPVDIQDSCKENTSFDLESQPTPCVKKDPPPVPSKPDPKKKIKGSLIQKQLKNLEECSRFSKEEEASSFNFEGFKSLQERRKLLTVSAKKEAERKGFPASSALSSVDLCDISSPHSQGDNLGRKINFGNKHCTIAAKGWVKHVIGKLQYEVD